ncbi:MAG: PIN domain-containing protein [Campylobacterota bacterium]|nr:PIN domain-containing protein [Campylobacterota bacterium]
MLTDFCIDSDTLIYFLKGEKEVIEQMSKVPIGNLYTTRINYTELLFGAYNSTRVDDNLNKILPFLENFKILEFDKKSAEIFAKIKAKLKKDGQIIADMDLMIASISISNNCNLISNNTKHFSRIKELKLNNWL